MVKTPLDDWIGRKIGLQPGNLSREAIEDYQLNQLRETMALAKEKSAYYRNSLALVDPQQITFAEFAELPFTFPQDINGMDYIYLNLMKAESQTLDEQGIHRALQTIPAIRNGMDQDQLKVVVNVSENQFPVSKGTLKREILDNRYRRDIQS